MREMRAGSAKFILNDKAVLILATAFIFSNIFIGIILLILSYFFKVDLYKRSILQIPLSVFGYIFPIFILYKFVLKPAKQSFYFNWRSVSVINYFFIIPMMFGMILLGEYFVNLLPTEGIFWGEMYKNITENIYSLSKDKIFFCILVVAVVPVLEELLFRGVILSGLLNKGVLPNNAICISSLIFGIFHGNPWQFVGSFLLGMVLGLVYQRTKSLFTVIFLHALNNLLAVLMLFYIKYENYYEVFGMNSQEALGFGLIIFCLNYYFFVRINKDGDIIGNS